ncbi:ABC transporter transmembrane domain-containing protein [Clostridium sulfidigenes]|uniref:ABC transporter transmembrane domain-containing protein n=1 Tax=Clostridium sulfidigenes TaxID=318464 RepID=UPI000691E4E4|nr:ABC transporter ATP-binding protein [Clostridium sulfidigenes]
MLNYLIKKRINFFATLIFSSFNSLLAVGLAYVMMTCVDFATSGQLSSALNFLPWLLLYLLLCVCIDLLYRKSKWECLSIAKSNLRDDTFKKIQNLSSISFHKKNTGEWISLLTNDLDIVEESYFSAFFRLFESIFELTISLLLLLLISPILAGFVLLITFIQLIIPKIMSKNLSKAKGIMSDAASSFTTTASEHLTGMDLLKCFHVTAQSFDMMSERNNNWEKKRYHSRLLSSFANLMSFTMGNILYIGIYFIGAILVILGYETVGTLVAASQLVVYISSPLVCLSDDLGEIKSAREIIHQLHNNFDDTGIFLNEYKQIDKTFEALRVVNLDFNYDDNTIFSDVNFEIAANKKYFFSAQSGSGKTTLINLLIGTLPPTNGNIYFNHTNITELNPVDYNRFLQVSSQNTFIFNATLRNNITLFSEQFTDKEINDVIERVGLKYILERTRQGLDQVIGQSGFTLSGGEKQRIALARIELFNPNMIIYDESFANLDEGTTQELLELILSRPKSTVIIISHQMSPNMIKWFDYLITINNKKIAIEEIESYE